MADSRMLARLQQKALKLPCVNPEPSPRLSPALESLASQKLPEIPATAKVQFIRASNPEASHTRLRRESVESLEWFASTISQSPQRPLAMPSTLQRLAAADACAEDTKVGIGGWVIIPTAVAWFAESHAHGLA